MKIWLDDIRPAPAGFTLCRSVNEAKKVILEAEEKGIAIPSKADSEKLFARIFTQVDMEGM